MTDMQESDQKIVLDTMQQMIEILNFYMDVRLDYRLSRLLVIFKHTIAMSHSKLSRSPMSKRRRRASSFSLCVCLFVCVCCIFGATQLPLSFLTTLTNDTLLPNCAPFCFCCLLAPLFIFPKSFSSFLPLFPPPLSSPPPSSRPLALHCTHQNRSRDAEAKLFLRRANKIFTSGGRESDASESSDEADKEVELATLGAMPTTDQASFHIEGDLDEVTSRTFLRVLLNLVTCDHKVWSTHYTTHTTYATPHHTLLCFG